MQDFLHRLRLLLIGEAGIYVLMGGGGVIALFLFSVSPVLAVLFLVVLIYVAWRFFKWIRVQDAHYTDTEGRIRCRRCRKIVYSDGESAHGAAEGAAIRGTYLRAYYESRCGNWHLTSQVS